MKSFKVWSSLVATIAWSPLALAKPLSVDAMKGCDAIAVIAGTYDPFTNGHEGMGRRILATLPFDCVLFLPTKDPPHKMASPMGSRVAMLDAALKGEDKLFYPTAEDLELGTKEYIEKIRGNTRKGKVFAVLGSDLSDQNRMYLINEARIDPDGYIISARDQNEPEIARLFQRKENHILRPNPGEKSISSTDVRKWFVANDEVYFKAGAAKRAQLPNDLVRPAVSEYIIKSGLYLGSNGDTSRGVLRIATSAFMDGLNKLGLFHPLREIKVNQVANPDLTEITIDGKVYKLEKHLGSGLTADAYIINYDGEKLVIKIANERPKSPGSILQDMKIGTFLNERTTIKVPKVRAVDPEGKWRIGEFVGGESLGDYLERTKGEIEPAIKTKLRAAIRDMLELSKATNIKLDLSVDNLKIWNGELFLIDAGPIPPDVDHPMSYNEFVKNWMSAIGEGRRSRIKAKLKSCGSALSDVLRSAGSGLPN